MKDNNNALTLTILTTLYLLHNVPVIGYYTPAVLFLVITILLYFALVLAIGQAYFSKILLLAFPVVSIPFLRLLLVLFVGEHAFTLEVYSFVQVLIYPLLGLYIMKSKNYAFCRVLFIILIMAYAITAVTTIIGCRMYPNAARALTGSQEDTALYSQYKQMNIGDFHFVYFITLTLPLLIGSIRYQAIGRTKGLLLAFLVLVTVYYSAYTTALLFCILAVFLLFVPKDSSWKSLILLSIVGVIVVFAARIFISNLFSYASESVANEDVASRLADISALFVGETADQLGDASDTGLRLKLFERSWQVFADNPIFGSWSLKAVGGHSFIFDTLGLFGIVGLFCIIWMYIRSFRLFLAPFKHKSWFVFLLTSYLFIIVQAILNPQPTINVLSFILPMYACLMDKEKK